MTELTKQTRAEELTERIRQHARGINEALVELHADMLYLEMGYKTMEEWAKGEFGWSRSYLHRNIEAAKITLHLSENVAHGQHPTTERQVRPLVKLEPDEQIEAWERAVEKAGGVPSERIVIETIGEMRPVPDPAPLPEGTYNVLYADPPWKFDNTGFEQSAEMHYPTMTTEDIGAMGVPEASVCFLWACASMIEDALYVLKEWGFEYKTHMIWVKNKGPSTGWYLQTRHELLLIGVKKKDGRFPHPSYMPVSWIEEPAGKHSAKPHKFYEIIEQMYEGPYLELFARNTRDGWNVWGNEID